MPIKPSDAKKLATEFNTTDLKSLMEVSDELMRVVMEAGDLDTAEEAAQISAEMAAALIVRKNDVRELAKRVRDRVTEEGPAQTESSTTNDKEAAPASTDSQPAS
ncbi:MAG: hypothetical protein AB1489_08890 [Acidobacteriota bacterium]